MDIKKFEVLLKKINTLKQNLDLSGNEIPDLELELLKNYIMELYATISDEEMEKPRKKKKKKIKAKRIMEVESPQEVDEDEEIEEGEAIEEIEIVAEPEDVDIIEEEEENVIEEVIDKEVIEYDPDLLSLFDGSSVSELSEKLSLSPIKDLRKAIGLNDKIFTINELFGGDKDLFTNSMAEMNDMNDFEDAKVYLLEKVAKKFDWGQKDNQKKAKRFIKIVQRRFA